MTKKIQIALALLISMSAGSAFAKPKPSIAGTWTGFYLQPVTIRLPGLWGTKDHKETRKITFTMHLRETKDGIQGEITEANNYGENRHDTPIIRTTVSGKRDGNQVTFTKSYDVGVIHYQGTLESDGRRMRGTWKWEGNTSTFEANLVQPRPTPTP